MLFQMHRREIHVTLTKPAAQRPFQHFAPKCLFAHHHMINYLNIQVLPTPYDPFISSKNVVFRVFSEVLNILWNQHNQIVYGVTLIHNCVQQAETSVERIFSLKAEKHLAWSAYEVLEKY